MRKVSVTAYKYNELNETAQQIAYEAYLTIIAHFADAEPFCDREDVKQAKDKCLRMQTPWFFASYLDEINGDNIKKELEEFEFYEDGTQIPNSILEENFRLHEVCSAEQDANGISIHHFPIRTTELNANFSPKTAITSACEAYLSTPEGKEKLEECCGYFNIGDFMLHVPDEFCKQYGFEKVIYEPEVTVFVHGENIC
jgi:hypothetical protein